MTLLFLRRLADTLRGSMARNIDGVHSPVSRTSHCSAFHGPSPADPVLYRPPMPRSPQPKPAPTRRLNIALIRTNAGTQTRAGINEQTVADYGERMIAGDHFPPVVVFYDGQDFILSDGFHRVRAAKLAKFDKIEAEIHKGTRLDALKFSLAANHRHGLRRSNEDKRHSITVALKEFSDLSDRAIAALCGVTHPSVSAVRRQLVNFSSCPKRLGRDGKHRRLPVKPGNGSEPYLLPGKASNGEDELAHEILLEVTEKFADLETTIISTLSRFPDQKPVIVALIRKVKSDLTHLEKAMGQHGR